MSRRSRGIDRVCPAELIGIELTSPPRLKYDSGIADGRMGTPERKTAMHTDEVVDILREHEGLLREFHVMELYVFGSVVRGEDRPDSDVDILVKFADDAEVGLFAMAQLQRRLSEILARPVDLVTRDELHEALKDQILEEAVRAA